MFPIQQISVVGFLLIKPIFQHVIKPIEQKVVVLLINFSAIKFINNIKPTFKLPFSGSDIFNG